jgi:hypothetical protein
VWSDLALHDVAATSVAGVGDSAADLVSPITPCLAAAYAACPAIPFTPAPEDVFTIAPPPPASSNGICWCMHRNTPVRFTSTIRFHTSSVMSGGRGDGSLHAGIVERHIEAPERRHRLVERCGNVVAAGDVARRCQRASALLLDQPGGL